MANQTGTAFEHSGLTPTLFMDMPPLPTRELPVIMAQASNGKRGGGGEGDVVMQDLTPFAPVGVTPVCFAAGTLVHTKEGLKPIEEIRVGDWVLSHPEHQTPPRHLRQEHEYTYRQVTQTFVTEDQPLSKLIVLNLVTGNKESFLVTANHPIFCENRGGWIPASEIEAGDAVENHCFGNLLVARLYHAVERARVYNFEVEEFHTYYVGENGVWVHNACPVEITKVPSLEAITNKVMIYSKPDFMNFFPKGSDVIGRIGESAGNNALYKSTGLEFNTIKGVKYNQRGQTHCCPIDSE